jgi:TRAP-type C4-dicarboxylate transport system substrate-binding protein
MNRFQGVVFLLLLNLGFAGIVSAGVLKIATLAPEGSEWMLEHRAAATKVKELTEGRVTLKFYGGGVMGNDKKVLRKMRIGQLQGAAFSTSGLMERYPDIILYGLPFVYRSQAEVDYTRELFDARLIAGLRDAGFVSFGFAGGGFATFMSSDPISEHADLKGMKIWVPEGDVISYTTLESMDLSPVVLPLSDVLTGLQTGLLDAIVTPPSAALLLQWYTKMRYINPTPVSYTMGIIALDERAYDRLSPTDQKVLKDVFAETYARLDEINRSDNVEAQDALLENGLQLVESNPKDVPYWHKVAAETNATLWAKNAVDPDLFGEFMAALEEYRSANASEEAIADAGK